MTIEPFENIYNEIERRLRKTFGEIPFISQTAALYGEIKKLPAIFIEMVDLDPLSAPGTGEIEVLSHWEIRVLISAKQKKSEIAARNAALRIGALFHDQILVNKLTMAASFQGASDDGFDLKVPQYESWVSYFDIPLRVGEDDWGRWEFYAENLSQEEYFGGGTQGEGEVSR